MIYFITGNEGKFREAKSIISELEQLDIDLVEIQSIDPREIIKAKLDEASKHRQGSYIVEDTSLYLDCIPGLPGPLIKWFIKTIGNDGLAKLATRLENSKAKAAVMVGLRNNGEMNFFEGVIKGKIVLPRGENGFGWDAIFQPDGLDKTFAEITTEVKNAISMRKIAFKKLKDYLEKNEIVGF